MWSVIKASLHQFCEGTKLSIAKRTLLVCLAVLANFMGYSQIPQDLRLDKYEGQLSIQALNSVTLLNGFHIPMGGNATIGIAAFPSVVSKPTAFRNFILTRSYRVAGVNAQNLKQSRSISEENQSIQYFDGLGRNIQQVEIMASPTYKDIVQHKEYDNQGRESINYLPHAKNVSGDGAFNPNARYDQLAYYSENGSWDLAVVKTNFPYAATLFENSPLNRVLEQGAPGASWQLGVMGVPGGGHTVRTVYGSNVESTQELVRLWIVDYNSDGIPTGAKGTGKYSAGRLSKTTIRDENWISGKAGTVDEYKDFDDRVVLKRVWNVNPSTKAEYPLDTYYVYGNFGNLCYVIPPAVKATSFTELATDANFDKYIYAYRYDERKRMIWKKIPGKGPEYFVYNKNDQLVFTRDAEQLKRGEWGVIKYDAFGRTVMTGVESGHPGDNHTALQNALKEFSGASWEDRGTVLEGYTNKAIPQNTVNMTVLQVYYYNDYNNIPGIPFTNHAAYSKKLKTLLTASKVRVLGKDDWLWIVNHYDDDARLVNIQSTDHLGGIDAVTNTYSFPGELLTSTRSHTPKGGKATIITTTNSYDHIGRLASSKEKIGSQAEVILASNSYNEIGQLKTSYMGKVAAEPGYVDTTNYTYNERGWLSKSISPRFSQQLKYGDGTTPQWNGNISGQLWNENDKLDGTAKNFSYGYDRLNRLTSGTSTPAGAASMTEVMSYDDMGNIKTLKRDALVAATYAYNGNKLTKLTGGLSGDYTYDDNGNVKTDRLGMAYTYNYLNLPQTVTKVGTDVSFLYDAGGTKLRKFSKIGTSSPISVTRDYIGGIEYNNGKIEIIHNAVGYAMWNGTSYVYHYNLMDHLGNVRASLKRGSSAKIVDVVQRDNYYPFGKRKVVLGGNNKYLYNGKEIQGELGDSYDHGARFYDAEIGRWNVVDPLADDFTGVSPYNYVYNNPLAFTDPNGMFAEPGWYLPNGATSTSQAVEFEGSGPITGYTLIPSLPTADVYGGGMSSWASGWNSFSNFFNGFGLGWSFSGQSSGAYGPYLPTDKDINNAGAVLSMIPATAPLGVVMQLSTAQSKAEVGMVVATSLPYMRIVKGIGGAAAKGVTNAGEMLGGFGIPKLYTYTNNGKSVFVSAHAMKHLEELATNGAKLGPDYLGLLGQTYQKSLHSVIDDVLSRGTIQYRKMFYSGGNEIMFGAPRAVGELPAVIHFR
ncbi:MAG: RHS repeat-associated core domain-containing protein [Sphingobacterium sp.]|jgi:RHS repeat-associated protein|nr:RHS repeat-associated core domain-containing protein [Sphingobacterium sp.]